MRTRPRFPGGAAASGAAAAPAAGWPSGILMVKVVPSPIRLSTPISPLCSLTMPYETDRPSPVPLPTGLVVKNGSKILLTTSGGMPLPVSATRMRAVPSPGVSVSTVIRPPPLPSMASPAFMHRLRRTCSIWLALPETCSGRSHRRASTLTFFIMSWCVTSLMVSETTALRSITLISAVSWRANRRRFFRISRERSVSLSMVRKYSASG